MQGDFKHLHVQNSKAKFTSSAWDHIIICMSIFFLPLCYPVLLLSELAIRCEKCIKTRVLYTGRTSTESLPHLGGFHLTTKETKI